VYEEALGICARALGVDSRQSAKVHRDMAIARQDSGDAAGALESAREAVRIYNKLGITDTMSQDAA
jgi:hypothetical protein